MPVAPKLNELDSTLFSEFWFPLSPSKHLDSSQCCSNSLYEPLISTEEEVQIEQAFIQRVISWHAKRSAPILASSTVAYSVGSSVCEQRATSVQAPKKPRYINSGVQLDESRRKWRCNWCRLGAAHTPTLRKGPKGKKTLCNSCGIWYSKHGCLPKDRYHCYDVSDDEEDDEDEEDGNNENLLGNLISNNNIIINEAPSQLKRDLEHNDFESGRGISLITPPATPLETSPCKRMALSSLLNINNNNEVTVDDGNAAELLE